MVTCEVSESATFKEMVVWPTVFDMQVLITNHFVLLRGKLIGGERHMKVFCKEGKVSDKEMNGSESLMKHRYHIRLIKTRMLSKFWDYNWVAKNVAPYKNIGACADNGAWECSGLNSVKGVQALKDKIFTVHLKDQKEFNVRNTPAVIYGTGVVDVAATIKALEQQGYDGYYIIEHGNDGDKREIISKDVEFIKNCK